MSREGTDVPFKIRGLSGKDTQKRSSITGDSEGIATAEQTVYRGRRDPAAPVGEEYTATVNSHECFPKRYDLLSVSPSGFSWGFSGSGPSQLSLAILAHTYNDEFACEYYQRFKQEVVTELTEEGWTLTKQDLDEWREVSIDGKA